MEIGDKLVRSTHPAGLEYWNDGTMDSGKMGSRDIDNIPIDKEMKNIQCPNG
jgi:hypothetical protein